MVGQAGTFASVKRNDRPLRLIELASNSGQGSLFGRFGHTDKKTLAQVFHMWILVFFATLREKELFRKVTMMFTQSRKDAKRSRDC